MERTLTVRNHFSEIPHLIRMLHEFGTSHGLTRQVVDNAALALEEVVSNTIKYGYEDDREHSIEVRLRLDGPAIAIEIRDDAKPFNPLDAPAPDLQKPFTEMEIGGLGVHLIRSLMDELDYSSAGGRNVLTMKKRLLDEKERRGE